VFFKPLLFSPGNVFEQPTDLWVPESNIFLSLYHSPLLILSVSLLVLSLYFLLRAFEEQRIRLGVYAGISSLALFILHPFYVPTIFLIAGVWLLGRCIQKKRLLWRPIIAYIVVCVSSLPVLVYFFWLYRVNDVFKAWSDANILLSPHPIMYIIGFGFLLPLCIYGAIRFIKDQRLLYVIVWFIAGAILLYAPFAFQRRLIEGLHVPIAILAALGAVALWKYLRKLGWIPAITFALLLGIFLPISNIYIPLQDMWEYHTNKSQPYYIDRDHEQVFSWLRTQAPHSDSIFSAAFYTGNLLPAYTLHPVFVGHGPQTIHLDEKLELHDLFFALTTSDEWRRQFLQDWKIKYVLFGPEEKALGGYEPVHSRYLQLAFTAGSVQLFTVHAESIGSQ